MSNTFVCQGRHVNDDDLIWLRSWIVTHSDWSRFRLAKELCKLWNWSTPTGQLKDFAARTFLRKLFERGLITLPPIRTDQQRKNGFAAPATIIAAPLPLASTIETSLATLVPLSFIVPRGGSDEEQRFHHYLARHHYLGFHRTVGENMKYLVRDRQGRDLACVLFGSAAWKTKPRDQFIGWSHETRARNLLWMTNNTRFLSSLGCASRIWPPRAGPDYPENQDRLANQIRPSGAPGRNVRRAGWPSIAGTTARA